MEKDDRVNERRRDAVASVDVELIGDIVKRLENPGAYNSDESLRLFQEFFGAYSLGHFKEKDEIVSKLIGLIQTPSCTAFGLMSFHAIVCVDKCELSDEIVVQVLTLIKAILAQGGNEAIVDGCLNIVLCFCHANMELVLAQFDIGFWCAAIAKAQRPETSILLFKILTRYLREMKTKGIIMNRELSTQITDILDHFFSTASEDHLEMLKAVFECCWAFATANKCWITLFQNRGILDKLHIGLTMKGATIKRNTLLMMAEIYKDGRSVDKFDIRGAIALLNHQSCPVQTAAATCLEKYLQGATTSQLSILLENGLLQQILDGLHNGPYEARSRFALIAQEILDKVPESTGHFLEGGILEAILPLLESTTKRLYITKLTNILRLTKRFCVAHGTGPEFFQQFLDNNGYEILEKLTENTDELIAEDATILLKEIDKLTPE